MKSKLFICALIGIILGFSSCQNDLFFNPFKLNPTITTAEIPAHFNWTLASNVDLKVHFEIIGDTVEQLEGHFLYLLDSSKQVISRSLITDNLARVYHKIDRSYGKMYLYLPLTGNYELVYSSAPLGDLLMEIAWQDPDIEDELQYLEITELNDKIGLKGLKDNQSGSVFGNNDFSNSELGTEKKYTDIKRADGKWYRTTQSGVPVTIEEYEGNNGLKMGQSGNSKDVEVGQVIEWSDPGEFIVNFDAISPTSDPIKLKVYLYFFTQNWIKLKQVTANLNLNNPLGWQNIEISGEVPDNNKYILLIFQDYDSRQPFFIDDVTTNFDSDPDADDDGVPDTEDQYPDDALKAFNNYIPGAESFSSLAFEDLWPYKGDYDFNDLVVDWRFNEITNSKNLVVAIEGTIILRAIGGSFHNGFGFELPIENTLVESVSGLTLNEGLVSIRSNGTEDGQKNAVIIIFEDAYNKLQNPGYAYVNTREGDAYIDPAIINFTITLMSPQEISELGLPPYNPFIFVNGDRGREVHLHSQNPTDLADRSFLGHGDDFSDTVLGERYYQTASNLPFGMEIPSTFDYPIEKAPIDSAYNYFINWAESGGREKTDWHQNKQGYRRTEKIFKK